jgi:hypothetical protein
VYIEFQLPHGISTRVISGAIKSSIALWANQYQIPESAYSQKTIKYTHRLGFNYEKYFSLFIMTYKDFDFRLVNIANEKY